MGARQMDETSAQAQTIDLLQKIFFINFQENKQNQLTNMICALNCFCEFFNNTDEELAQIKFMHEKPILYVLTKHKNLFTEKQRQRLNINKTIDELEHIYSQDIRFKTLLKKEYYADDNKPMRKRFMLLSDILIIRGNIKMDLFNLFSRVAIKNNVPLKAESLPQIYGGQIQQVGVESYEQ